MQLNIKIKNRSRAWVQVAGRSATAAVDPVSCEGKTACVFPVATLGLLPAALSHAIGSDSQRPFAIVIVGGLIVDLIMSTFLLPTS